MAISTEGKIGIGLALVLGMSTAALVLFPDAKAIAWATLTLSAVGLVALVIYDFRERGRPNEEGDTPPAVSITVTAARGGKVRVARAYSTADKFAHAEEEGWIEADGIVHHPSGTPGRAAAPTSQGDADTARLSES